MFLEPEGLVCILAPLCMSRVLLGLTSRGLSVLICDTGVLLPAPRAEAEMK